MMFTIMYYHYYYYYYLLLIILDLERSAFYYRSRESVIGSVDLYVSHMK